MHPDADPGPAPDNAFVRYNARMLDPTTAGRLADGRAPQQTAYVSDRLLVTAETQADAEALLADLDEALRGSVYRRRSADPFRPEQASAGDSPAGDRSAELLRVALAAGVPVSFTVSFDVPTESAEDAPPPVDVWPLLRRIRQRGTDLRRGDDARVAGVIGLDHLMFASPAILGNPAHPIGNGLDLGPGPAGSFAGHGPVAACSPRRAADPIWARTAAPRT